MKSKQTLLQCITTTQKEIVWYDEGGNIRWKREFKWQWSNLYYAFPLGYHWIDFGYITYTLQPLIWITRISGCNHNDFWAFPFLADDAKFYYKRLEFISSIWNLEVWKFSYLYTGESLEPPCITTKIFRTHQWNSVTPNDKVEIENEL